MRLGAGVLLLLSLASVVGWWLGKRAVTDEARATIGNLNARTRAWWMMVAVFGVALAGGRLGMTVLFGLLSFLALREFITLTPTRAGDHRTLFWVFFVITPLQYLLVAEGWYGMFVVLIPVYAFLFVPLRSAVAGDCERFLERTAEIQWGLMVCVYCLSHAAALLHPDLLAVPGDGVKLLVFLVAVAQLSDVFQYVWGKTLGRHRVAPTVSPGKTWEGLVGGVATVVGIGTALWWITPFSPLQAAGMSLAIAFMGFAGGLVMSAIKRDRGVKDWGALIEGHGGILDRLDSLCFAAPVFFHLTRFYLG